MSAKFITLTPKQVVSGKLHIRDRDVVWLHMDQSPGAGTVICHTRGTTSVNESIDQIKSRMDSELAVFTLEGGGGKTIRVLIAVQHIRAVMEIGKRIRLRLSRGEFEILQDIDTVKRYMKEPV